MSTVTATAYTFDELSPEAQKVAIEKSRYVTTEYYEWWDSDFDYWKDKLEGLGFTFSGEKVANSNRDRDAIYFSGFSSQGDGASFECGVDIRTFLKAHKLANTFRSLYYWSQDYGYMRINQNGHYYHEMTMSVSAEWDAWGDDVPEYAQTQFEELEDIVLSKARKYAKQIYRELQSTYESMMEDDYVADHIHVNEYLFWASGRPALIEQ